MIILQGKEEQMLDSKELKIQSKTRTHLCWGKTRMLSMITQIIEGQGWYFSTWIRSISLKSSECWWWSWHIYWEVSWRYYRSSTTSSKRKDGDKSYWNHGYDTHSESSLLFKAKWYDEESWHKLSSSSKIVLREEGPGSTVKISTILLEPSRLGMTDRVQTRKQRRILRAV